MSKVEEDVKGSAAVVGDGGAVTAGDGTAATTASAGASVDIEAHAREWERGAATLRSHEGLPFSTSLSIVRVCGQHKGCCARLGLGLGLGLGGGALTLTLWPVHRCAQQPGPDARLPCQVRRVLPGLRR